MGAGGKGGKRWLLLSPATFVSACIATEDEGGWIRVSAEPVPSAAAPWGVGTAVTMALAWRMTGERGGGRSGRRASVAADR